MNTEQVIADRKRLEQIDRERAVVHDQKVKAESELASTHAEIRTAVAKRGAFVDELLNAQGDRATEISNRLDVLEAEIVMLERRAEGLQRAIAKSVQEMESLNAEFTHVVEKVTAEENAQKLQAYRVRLTQAARRATESIRAARLDWGALRIESAKFQVEFGDASRPVCDEIFSEFYKSTINTTGMQFVDWGFGQFTRIDLKPMRVG